MIKNKIKTYREKNGFSQEKTAVLIGVSRNALASIERGEAIPNLKIALKLSLLFNVNVEDLFYFDKN